MEPSVTGSRPAKGSSASSTSGRATMARATPARFFMPPDSTSGRLSAASLRPTRSSASIARAFASSSATPRLRSGKSTLSSTVIESNSASVWNTMPKATCAARALVGGQRRHVAACPPHHARRSAAPAPRGT